jgi:hypothetical protein
MDLFGVSRFDHRTGLDGFVLISADSTELTSLVASERTASILDTNEAETQG